MSVFAIYYDNTDGMPLTRVEATSPRVAKAHGRKKIIVRELSSREIVEAVQAGLAIEDAGQEEAAQE